MHRRRFGVLGMLLAFCPAVVLWSCGGGSSGAGGSPTQPTPQPPSFTLALEILNVTPAGGPLGLDSEYTSPVSRYAETRVTVTETGRSSGGTLDSLLFEFLTRGNSKVWPRTISGPDIIKSAGTNKVPAGGTLTFLTTATFVNSTGDIVTTLNGTGTLTADTGQTSTVTTAKPVTAPQPCASSATALCLAQSRFKVDVSWRGQTGQGTGTAITEGDDSGRFWFMDATAPELQVKVLNHCVDLQRYYWVFFSSTTNVEYRATVTDTATGAVKKYTNHMGQRLGQYTDTAAFATCP